MSSGDGRLRKVFPVAPGGGLVVEAAGLQASVQDAGEPVGQPPECVVVFESLGSLLVVEGAGAGRGVQGGEGLGHERADQPVVVDEPGRDDLFLARGAGDGAGGGVVLAGLAVGVPVRAVAEFSEHPGAEDGCQAGLGLVDLSVRVPAKMLPHLLFQGLDLLVQGGDHRDQGPGGGRVGGGQRGRLGQAAINAEAAADGWHALLTNLPRTITAEQALTRYKNQPGTSERRYHDLKGPLAVAPMFLHANRRMTALIGVICLALLIYCLTEREARRNLAPALKLDGLYAGRAAKPTASLTFATLAPLRLRTGADGTPEIPEPDPIQKRVLHLLKIDPRHPR